MNILTDNPSDESENIEFKFVSKDSLPHDLWEPITGFSNADGGFIKFGVEENGNKVGVNPKYLNKLQEDLLSQCNSEYNHKLYPELTIENSNILSVYIPPVPASLRPIYSSKRGCPQGGRVRIGPTNAQLDDEWLRRFAIAAGGGAELLEFQAKTKDYFDSTVIKYYLDTVKEKRGNVYKGLSQQKILIKLRAVVNNNITMFGLLAFSTPYGLQELTSPTVNIAVTEYAGTSKVNPEDIDEIRIDDKEFSGNVVSQFEEALKFIQNKLPVKSRLDPEGKRSEYLAIPLPALREILANAIVHRDYTTFKSRIQIDIYSDRIEFSNPGRSLIPLNLIETAHSQTRNPLLMSYLKDLNITEQRGRGISTIKKSLRAAGLLEPTFEHRHDWFVATVHRSGFITDDDQTWLQQFKLHNLNDRQLNALVHLRHHTEGISNSEYRGINNMTSVADDSRAKRELGRLVGLGVLRKTGNDRSRKYFLK